MFYVTRHILGAYSIKMKWSLRKVTLIEYILINDISTDCEIQKT